LRPPDAASTPIVISTSDQANVIFATNANEKISAPIRAADHPIAANVDWSKLNATTAKPQANWRPVVSAGDQMLVGVRESPARQVWIGFNSPTFSHSSDFVVFWTNVLDWVGRGGDEFVASGARAVPIPAVIRNDWQKQLRDLPATQRAGWEVSSPLLIGAIIFVLAAMVCSACKNCAAG
jgi:hypothetical protein